MDEHKCHSMSEDFAIDNSANGHWHLIISEYDYEIDGYIQRRYSVNFCPSCGVKL